MPKNTNLLIWNYYEKNQNEKTAVCLLCSNKISYKSTTTNLKQHLRIKHISSFNEYLSQNASQSNNGPMPVAVSPEPQCSSSLKISKNANMLIWNYYEKNQNDKIAKCMLCNKNISYKTTTTNLKQHLRIKHINTFNEILSQDRSGSSREPRPISVGASSEAQSSGNVVHGGDGGGTDEEAEELLKVNDIWSFFATDTGRKARCIICDTNLTNEYEHLKAHLKDNHPNLLLQIMQDTDQLSDAASNNDADNDNDNTYTEIVYLEQEPLTDTIVTHKETLNSFPTPATKRERFHSSDEIPPKITKDDDNDELGIFIKYITCLLKKLPANMFTTVQIEIVNVILKANSQVNKEQSMVSNQDQGSTSSKTSNIVTVDGITPINSTVVGHNYSVTLAPTESESANR